MDLRSNITIDHVGIFHEKLRRKGAKKQEKYYYATVKGNLPIKNEQPWYYFIDNANDLLEKTIVRSATSNFPQLPISSPSPSKKRKLPPDTVVELRMSEALALENSTPFGTLLNVPSSSSVHHCSSSPVHHPSPSPWSYWDSPEARKLVKVCCAAAIKASKRLGISTVKNPKTVEKWYRSFWEKRSFTIPLKYKHNLPLFLELNPDVSRAIKEYANSNLANLSVEMVSEYLHTVILPKNGGATRKQQST